MIGRFFGHITVAIQDQARPDVDLIRVDAGLLIIGPGLLILFDGRLKPGFGQMGERAQGCGGGAKANERPVSGRQRSTRNDVFWSEDMKASVF